MNPIVTALAIQRLTQVVVKDEISAPVRDRIMDWAKDAAYGSPKERIAYLVGCGACTSIWSSAAVLGLNRFPLGRLAVKVLAGSSIALLIDKLASLEQEES